MNNIDMSMFSHYITNFIFILLRTGIFIGMLPVFGSKSLPVQFKIGFVIFIALLLTPVVDFQVKESNIPLLVINEILIAVALGFAAKFIFMAVNMAGIFVSHAIGMSMASMFNPEMGQSTIIAELYGIIAMLLFLAVNAHHDLIYVFAKSYEVLPAGQFNAAKALPKIISIGSKFFVMTIIIAAPIIVGLLLSQILTGFLYKAAPLMNVFFITWPLSIIFGFTLMFLSLPVLEHVLTINFSEIKNEMSQIMVLAKG